METKRVTCPESGHLEEVDLEHTPSGLIVIGCSRFEPRCAPSCPRECARRMDRREHAGADLGDRVLVICSHHDGRTLALAEFLAGYLRRDGLTVELADASAHGTPAIADYDAVVVGSAVRFGKHSHAVTRYVRAHRDELASLPTFFFSVGDAGAPQDPERYVTNMIAATGWLPTRTTRFMAAGPTASELEAFALVIGEEIPAASASPPASPPSARSAP